MKETGDSEQERGKNEHAQKKLNEWNIKTENYGEEYKGNLMRCMCGSDWRKKDSKVKETWKKKDKKKVK